MSMIEGKARPIEIYPDLEALSVGAADLFVQRALQASAGRSRFMVALSGGNTPRRTYELMAEAPFRDLIPWEKIEVFDEV
ncbi:MAG: 6-phosphogluconolactonase [Chloroflexi bacterium]|nr:6-phosphogluconolactonase [Chloroflexota bacterium]